MAATKHQIEEVNREVQYDIFPEIESLDESSNINLRASYQAKEDYLPDADCIIDRNPDTDVLQNAKAAIEYNLNYDNQGIKAIVYSDGENIGVEVQGNGKSEEFISDFREAALEEQPRAEINGNAFSIRGFLS